MRIFSFVVLSLIILGSCGKKSDPKYMGKIKYEIKFRS